MPRQTRRAMEAEKERARNRNSQTIPGQRQTARAVGAAREAAGGGRQERPGQSNRTGQTPGRSSGTARGGQRPRSPGASARPTKIDRQPPRPAQAVRQGSGSSAPKKGSSGSNFLVQGSILAAAGIVVRLIGMVYRIPLARKIGDVGNGYYNAAYSIYSLLLIMSSYSLPVAVSKMISARLARGQYRNSSRIFKAALFYATLAGLAGFLALWFGAEYFAAAISMPYSVYAIKALAPTIWVMAYLGVLRGYFQGHSTMIPTALSQIFEQVVNAVVSIVAASVLFDMGLKSNLVFGDTEYSYAFGAAGGAVGTGAGALTAFLLFLFLLVVYRPIMRRKARRDKSGYRESYGEISRLLFFTILPIIVSSAVYNISNVIDNGIFGNVMKQLEVSDQEIASHWGVYMGRYHLLFNIPVAIANSLSSSLIPSLSKAVAEKNKRQVLARISSAIRFSMIIAIPSAVGLAVLAGPVSNLLFSGMDNAMLITMMLAGSSAVVVFSLSTVTNAVLQGLNHMAAPIVNSAVSLVIHTGILYVMLRVFRVGIYSVVYANILFAALVCVLNGISIARAVRYRQEVIKTFLIPGVCSGVMGAAAWGMYRLCSKAAGNGISTAAAILAAVAVYFVLLIKLKGVDEKELKGMPGGTRLFRLARRFHLM